MIISSCNLATRGSRFRPGINPLREAVPVGYHSAVSTAKNAARVAKGSSAFRRVARAGFVVVGLVHLLIGVIAISIASGAGGDADQDGAMEQIRRTPIGGLLLTAMVVGLVALAAWQIAGVFLMADPHESRKWGRRVKAAAISLAYLVVAGMALIYALGGRADSEKASQGLSAWILSAPGGAVMLVLIGLTVVGVGAGFVIGGVTRAFERELRLPAGAVRPGVLTFGVIGYIAKGVAVIVTGVLVVAAAWTRDPEKAAGLDGALHSLMALPYGRALLWLVGAGLAVYGIFCFVRARLARM